MDLAKFHVCNPQSPNIFSHKILVPDPISNLIPYLNSSWNFLSENVYFWYGRAKIFQVKLSWSSRGAKFSESGDVTLRVASSKRMAIKNVNHSLNEIQNKIAIYIFMQTNKNMKISILCIITLKQRLILESNDFYVLISRILFNK